MNDTTAPSTAHLARRHLRTTPKASLGTIDRATGAPYVSMVTIATDVDGCPILLLSGLARHTANLQADDRASLLLDSTDAMGDPTSGTRLTVVGRLAPSPHPHVRARYLSRHPEATMTADFADFAFWRMEIGSAHLIAGFGRIHTLGKEEVRLAGAAVDAIARDQGPLLAEYDTLPLARRRDLLQRALEQAPSPGAAPRTEVPTQEWRPTGIDPEGLDVRAGSSTRRLSFDTLLVSADEVRAVLQAR